MYAIYVKYAEETKYGHKQKIFMATDIEQVKEIMKRETGEIDRYYSDSTISSTFHEKLGEGYFQRV